MNNMRRGFTMIELIFVIVIIGILAAVAIPKLASTAEKATISTFEAFMGTLNRSVGPAMWAVMVVDTTAKGSVASLISAAEVAEYTALPDEFLGLNFANCAATPGVIGTLLEADSGLDGDIDIYCKDGTLTSAPTFGFARDGNETNSTFQYRP